MNRVEMSPAYYYDEFPSRVKIKLISTSFCILVFCFEVSIEDVGLFPYFVRRFTRLLATMPDNTEACNGMTRKGCGW